MFTETAIISLTDLLLGDTYKKPKTKTWDTYPKKSIPAKTDENSTNLDAG